MAGQEVARSSYIAAAYPTRIYIATIYDRLSKNASIDFDRIDAKADGKLFSCNCKFYDLSELSYANVLAITELEENHES